MKALILLNGSISKDARVIRQLNAVAAIGEAHLYSIERKNYIPPINLCSDVIVTQIRYPFNLRQKVMKHSFISREYDFLAKEVIQSGETFDICIANDLPTLRSGILLKKAGIVRKLYYDAHEIYSETIKQFFPGMDSMPFYKKAITRLLTKFMVHHAVKFEKKNVCDVDVMMTVNKSLSDYFAKHYKIDPPEIIRSIPDIKKSEVSKVFDYRNHYDWTTDTKILIYQGMLNSGRGMKLCIETMTLLDESYKLVVIGDGPLFLSLKSYVKDTHLSERVKFLGSVPNHELNQYTKGADVGLCLIEPINLSKELSLPNKIFEYLHSGKPIIGSDIPEIQTIIEEYGIGIVSGLTTHEIAIKIKEVFTIDFTQNIENAQALLKWQNEKEKLVSLITSV